MKKLLVTVLIGLGASSAFADITAQLSAQPYPVYNAHHGDKTFVRSEHFINLTNSNPTPFTFVVTYKVCAEDSCYSLEVNKTLAPFTSWSDHENLMTNKKFHDRGQYKSSAFTIVNSGSYNNQNEGDSTISVTK